MMCFEMIICLVLMVVFYNIIQEDRKEEERIKKAHRIHEVWERIINGEDDPYRK